MNRRINLVLRCFFNGYLSEEQACKNLHEYLTDKVWDFFLWGLFVGSIVSLIAMSLILNHIA